MCSSILRRLSLLLIGLYLISQLESSANAREILFNRDVRPILSEHCFACHGPDANTREADLRLDEEISSLTERQGNSIISVESPEDSELLKRVTSADENERMPPAEHAEPLSAEEIDILREWISQGAAWQGHWAYVPAQRPEIPTRKGPQPAQAIDAFIRRKQVDAGLEMSPAADPRTLLRRLSFDLTGLPPTPEQVVEFQRDHSPAAYEAAVDRLLESPHFGERLAMYWLDLVRYADTLGYHGDQERSVSPYRDYVIQAFNHNMPFDQFTIEQLAGDLLPNPTLSQKVASTYNRINRASAEGGVQPKEYLAKYTADRVRTAGAVWLGSTFGCAECHDHKFDPFTTKDFYSFGAFFADIKEQGIVNGANHIEQMPVPTPDQAARQAELTAAIAAAETEYAKETPELLTAFENWKIQAADNSRQWTLLTPTSATATSVTTLTIEEDGAVRASGENPDKNTYNIEFTTDVAAISALRLEVLSDPALPQNGPGRAGNGNFVINQVRLTLNDKPVDWTEAASDHDQNGFTADTLATKNSKGWAILPEVGKTHQLVLRAKEPVELKHASDAPSKWTVSIVQDHGTSHTIGRFRLYAARPIDGQPADAKNFIALLELSDILGKPDSDRTSEENQKLNAAFRQQTPLLAEIRTKLAQLRSEQTALNNSIVTTLVTVSVDPREMRVLPRGNWMDDSGVVVTPNFPEFLPQPDVQKEMLNRLDLANWIVAPDNPLVARTFVNRLWMLMFGQGIARSVDDLGAQGEWPTHPELLDWLAVEFVESGWNMKHMIKLLVMSETYRQSSLVSQELRAIDPDNRFYARQSRWRLDAEMVRDNALAISGLLVDDVGGVSARPYQPAGYWDQLNFPKRTYQHDTGRNQYRRGVYTHWQRTFLHPSLLAFDAPAREECTARRDRSNTPIQSLVLLNDPTYVEAARVFAEQIAQQKLAFDDGLTWAFQKTLARPPRTHERQLLGKLFEKNLQEYQLADAAASQIVQAGIKPPEPNVDLVQAAAWTSVTRVILNLHETITRY